MKKSLLITLIFVVLNSVLQGQIVNPVKWTYSTEKDNANTVTLVFTAAIDKPWHLYGTNIPEGGPIPLTIDFEKNQAVELTGTLQQVTKPEIMDDPVFEMKVELHSHKAIFKQQIRKLRPRENTLVKGTINHMTCNDKQCVLNDTDFSFSLPASAESAQQPVKETVNPELSKKGSPEDTEKTVTAETLRVIPPAVNNRVNDAEGADRQSRGLLGTFLVSLLAGLGGLLTPCVYPMIPLTVAYFLRGNKTKGKTIAEALVFGVSIILIYTLIGVLVAVFKNPNAVNAFITHWITNLVFALIFIALAASFFGLFELVLPGSLSEKVDKQADKGGYSGAFFMALAMAILSFSCTGPIIASLLITASQGEVLEPVIGMLGFSVAFALPFTLFAIFPSWLQSLPKSGGWLNSVKVFFAFIMLAFSLYFLSKVDQAYHLNILTREVFLIIWIVLFFLLGLYLLGKIAFSHDSDLQHIGVLRLLFVVVVFSFTLYLFAGLLGNDLKGVSSLLPPKKEKFTVSEDQPGYPYAPGAAGIVSYANALCGIPAYSGFLSLPHGIQGYFEIEEALACAREKNKPLLIDFVGHTCSNCKKMYEQVWSDPKVLEILKNDYIIVALYTDDKTRLPEKDWIISSYDGKTKNTIGKLNQDLQITRFNSNALPLYVIVDGNGKELTTTRYTYSSDVQKFIRWLEEGKKEFGSKQ